MKKKVLLGALFIVILSNTNALEITEDKYLNDGLINFKNTKDDENKVTVTRNDITVQNKGILKIGYEELDVSVQNASDGIRTDVTNGILAISNNLIIDNTGIISSQIKMTGGNTTKIGDTYFIDSGNGIKTGVNTIINNSGIIQGNSVQIGGDIIADDSSSSLTRGFRVANGIWGNFVGENNGLIKGDSVQISGTATSYARSSVFNYTGAIGNGILGNFTGKNNGIISGNSIVIGGKAITTNIDINKEVFQNSYVHLDNGANGISGKLYNNHGLISGYVHLTGGENWGSGQNYFNKGYLFLQRSANGIYGDILENFGNIRGYLEIKSENLNFAENNEAKGYVRNIFSGNGMAFNGDILNNIVNSGLITGVQSAVAAQSILGTVNNYGVMAGREIFSDGEEVIKHDNTSINAPDDKVLDILQIAKENNQGIYIKLKEDSSDRLRVALDIDGDVIIEDIVVANNLNTASQGGTNNSGKTISNANVSDINVIENPSDENYIGTTITSGKDSYITVDSNKSYSDHIINGAGIKNAVLSVKENVTVDLKNSIVNGYKTAMSLDNNSAVIASNTIFNGGGLKNEDSVINIKGDNAALTIDGKSVINGLTAISGKDSIVSIGNEVMINGDIKSEKDKNNTLNLGDSKSDAELRLFHEIDGFSTINTSGNVTVYETAEISTGDIHIKDGNTVIRVDGTIVDSGKVIGHALYNHTGKITAELKDINDPITSEDIDSNAQLVFKASGLGIGTIIAMNGTDITNLYDPQIGTMSIAHTAIKERDNTGALTGDIIIDILNFDEIFGGYDPNFPTPELDASPAEPSAPDNSTNKGELEDIYNSIVKGEQLPSLAPTIDIENKTEEEAKEGLLSMLDQIYANNPYSYGGEMSYESLSLFTDNILKTKMPEFSEWIVQGHGIYGYDKFDKIKRKYKIDKENLNLGYSRDLTTTGAIGTLEYGLIENTSIGLALGGSKQKLDMDLSNVKGNIGYIGLYGKRRYGNFLLTGGLGYQYGEYDVSRVIGNKYQNISTSGEMKTNSTSVYIEGKYTIEIEKGTKIQPKVKVAYSHIKQNKISEKREALAIDMDKKNYSVPELEAGIDISKEIKTKSGKITTTAGISYVRVLGKNNSKLTGKMKDSTDFKVMGPEFKESKLRIEGNIEYEQTNGMLYNVGLGVGIGNKKEKEINARVGIGYRF